MIATSLHLFSMPTPNSVEECVFFLLFCNALNSLVQVSLFAHQFYYPVCWFAGAARRHHRQPVGLDNNLFSHSSKAWKSKIKLLAGLISSEASLLGLSMAIFMSSSFSTCLSLNFFLSGHIGLRPTLRTSF